MAVRSLAATLFLAASAFGKTDLAGCTYTDTVVQPSGLPGYDAYASRIWYVPGTGELCDILDCGGGRAPPKTDVPGCPLYSGTATYSPSYLDLKTQAVDAAATSSVEASATGAGTQVTVKATAQATTLATSVAVSESAPAANTAPTTAAPVVSSASSMATASKGLSTGTPGTPGRNGTSSGAHPSSTVPANGAAPTAAGVLGSVLAVGVAAAVAML
ncbi:uncharacterized protein TrAFT101_001429 [Trichoderma asperellum]|uniref:uncharacterized protein n=1 Tax=Trichoderma asperellum TaxID=101201 RepID=UPI00331F8DA6|nr:hypothetical protein TrAFT101_001429 [Trichoderma asperellum]